MSGVLRDTPRTTGGHAQRAPTGHPARAADMSGVLRDTPRTTGGHAQRAPTGHPPHRRGTRGGPQVGLPPPSHCVSKSRGVRSRLGPDRKAGVEVESEGMSDTKRMQFTFPVGYREFHKSQVFNFQLNRWYSFGYARLEDMEYVAPRINYLRRVEGRDAGPGGESRCRRATDERRLLLPGRRVLHLRGGPGQGAHLRPLHRAVR